MYTGPTQTTAGWILTTFALAGTYAASWMSAIAAHGGAVAAGSTYAWCQSVAMGGTAIIASPAAIGVAAIAVGGYGLYQFVT